MFSATSLLVLASACAVTVNAHDYKYCTTVQIGSKSNNHPVKLLTVYLPQKVEYDEVDIPTVPECYQGESGVQAVVCDDVPPTAQFQNFILLLVHRNGDLGDVANVTVTVYCN